VFEEDRTYRLGIIGLGVRLRLDLVFEAGWILHSPVCSACFGFFESALSQIYHTKNRLDALRFSAVLLELPIPLSSNTQGKD
jgi:hypothetical protein